MEKNTRKFRTISTGNIVKVEEWKASSWEPEFFDWFEPTCKSVYFADDAAAFKYLNNLLPEFKFNGNLYINGILKDHNENNSILLECGK
jgi:hypothetical protein